MMLLMCLVLAGCSQGTNGASAADGAKSKGTKAAVTGNAAAGEQITDNLERKAIKSASVLVQPDSFPATGMGNKRIKLTQDEIGKLSSLFSKVSLTQKMNSAKEAEESAGQFVQFDLTFKNGTKITVAVRSPYITYNGTTYKDYESSEKLNEFANQIISEKIVTYQCDRGSISLCIPDGWSHKIEKYKKTKEDESFGITFWKDKSKKKNTISIQYTKFFGVCGTGLDTKKIQINGIDGEAGYYDGKPYWDYIIFSKNYKNTFTVLNFCESETWWKQNGGQVMEILDTLVLEVKK